MLINYVKICSQTLVKGGGGGRLASSEYLAALLLSATGAPTV